jgi:hypothetical protein
LLCPSIFKSATAQRVVGQQAEQAAALLGHLGGERRVRLAADLLGEGRRLRAVRGQGRGVPHLAPAALLAPLVPGQVGGLAGGQQHQHLPQVMPVKDQLGWTNSSFDPGTMSSDPDRFILVDYTGQAAQYLLQHGINLHTTIRGLVTETPIGTSGLMEVSVGLEATNALTWVANIQGLNINVPPGADAAPLELGYRAEDLVTNPHLKPALSDVHFQITFQEQAGAPLPDLVQVLILGALPPASRRRPTTSSRGGRARSTRQRPSAGRARRRWSPPIKSPTSRSPPCPGPYRTAVSRNLSTWSRLHRRPPRSPTSTAPCSSPTCPTATTTSG